MDPVTIVGLVAGVIGIAATVGHLCNKVHQRVEEFKAKSDSVPEIFETIYINLPLLRIDLERFNGQIKHERPSDEVLTAYESLVKRLRALLTHLDDELKALIPADKDSPTARIFKAWKSIRFEAEADRIWAQICDCRNSLAFNRVVSWGLIRATCQWVQPILEIPQGRQGVFVGRQQVLLDIADLLSNGNGFDPPTVVLRGMGGQGKTQLALQFCIQSQELSGKGDEKFKKYHAILWVDATSLTLARKSFLRIYELVKAPDVILSDEDARIQYVRRIIQGWTFPWLLIFDNYDKPSSFPSIRDYMPIGQEGAVLVTSRHEDSSCVGRILDVPALSRDEAVDLLLLNQIHGEDDTDSTETTKLAEKIVLKLGCHALAVYQAGCFIRKNCTLSDFLCLYDEDCAKILSWTPTIWSYTKLVTETANHEITCSVFTTFQLAFGALPYDDKTAAKVRKFLEICSYLDISQLSDLLFAPSISDGIPALDLFRNPDGTWSQSEYQTIISGLREHGLISPCSFSRRTFAIHPLISDWLKIKQGASKEVLKEIQWKDGILAARLVRNCLEAIIQDLPRRYLDIPLAIRQEILPHALACEEMICKTSNISDVPHVHSICEALAEFLDSSSANDSARRIQEVAIKVLEYDRYTYQAKLTTSIRLLAKIYHHQGAYAKAEQLLQNRLSTVKDDFAMGDPSTLALAEMLISTLCYQCKFNEAAEHAARVLEIRKERRSDDMREMLKCRGALAWIWQNNHNIQAAEKEQKEILSARLQSFGIDDMDTLSSYNALGCIYLAQGKLEAAEKLLSNAVDGRTNRLGSTHPSTLNALTNLTMVFASQRRWDEAISKSKEILEARETRLGGSHIATLVSNANLLEIVKFAPKSIIPQDEVTCLQARLDEAAKGGLWDWIVPSNSDPVFAETQTDLSGKRGFERRKLMRHLGFIWRQVERGARSPTREQARLFQSQQQQQQ